MSTAGETIRLTSRADGFVFEAYHVRPTDARRGGLVLIQEIFGVTDHIRELADGFAEDGYEVIAPSFYDRQQPGFQASYEAADMQAQYDDKPAGNLRENVLMCQQYRVDGGGTGAQCNEDGRKPADESRSAGQYAARGSARCVNVGQFVKLQSGGKTQIARHQRQNAWRQKAERAAGKGGKC